MAHIGAGVEYALHCLLYLVSPGDGAVPGEDTAPSARDLAEFQGVSPSYLAKLFTKLEKAGLVRAHEGVRGGFQLARPPEQISFLDVVDAVEGRKPLFECREIRRDCILYKGAQPSWETVGVCSIHAGMLAAERAMRAELAAQTLADIAAGVARKIPARGQRATVEWFAGRAKKRRRGKRTSKDTGTER